MDELIEGVSLTPLRIIDTNGGVVMHAIKSSEPSFLSFGEAYFSTINKGSIKGWKLHHRMTLNLIVPVGAIRFVLFDDRNGSSTKNKFSEVTLGPTINYSRLTVKPNIWMAFQGVQDGPNILLNLASIEHDPQEVEQLPLTNSKIPSFSW